MLWIRLRTMEMAAKGTFTLLLHYNDAGKSCFIICSIFITLDYVSPEYVIPHGEIKPIRLCSLKWAHARLEGSCTLTCAHACLQA